MWCAPMGPMPPPSWPAGCLPVLVAVPAMPQAHVRAIEVDATTQPAVAVTGGGGESRLTVEYYVDAGAASPSVTLTIVADGQTTTWTDASIAAGYHVHHQAAVPPGSKLTLQASNALARVRWCETYWC